jgi:hypothetical protein
MSNACFFSFVFFSFFSNAPYLFTSFSSSALQLQPESRTSIKHGLTTINEKWIVSEQQQVTWMIDLANGGAVVTGVPSSGNHASKQVLCYDPARLQIFDPRPRPR